MSNGWRRSLPAGSPKGPNRNATRQRRLVNGIEPTEADVLKAVKDALELLRLNGRIVWWARMNSGAGRLLLPGGKASQWIEWGFPGCPDFMGMVPGGRFFACEAKRPTGRLTKEQKHFLALNRDGGAIAFVARSGEDVIANLYPQGLVGANNNQQGAGNGAIG